MNASETVKVIKEIRVYRHYRSMTERELISVLTLRDQVSAMYDCVNTVTKESKVVFAKPTRKGYTLTYEIVGKYLDIFISNSECETIYQL